MVLTAYKVPQRIHGKFKKRENSSNDFVFVSKMLQASVLTRGSLQWGQSPRPN
jgi:hypothetical protein